MNAEDQGVLLNSYKLPDICYIVKDYKTCSRHIMDLINSANRYIQISKALINLYEVTQNLTEEVENYNWPEAMEKVYNYLPSESQKEFIENMAQRQDFFKDAYEIIIGKMSQAVMERGEEVVKKQCD